MGSEEPDGSAYHIEAVDFAVRVLTTIAAEADLSMAEIARRTGVSRQRILRMLRTLESSQMIVRSGEGKSYRLGYRALLIGESAHAQSDVLSRAKPIMHRLGEAVQETVQLRIRDGDETVCIARWEPPRDVRVHAVVGRRRPLHVGSGKVFLAFMPQEEQERYMGGELASFTPRTPTDPVLLRERLRELREEKFHISRGELSEDLIAVAAPIFGAGGAVVAALTVGAPAARVDDDDIAAIKEAVCSSALDLSRQMGFRDTSAF